MGVNRIDKLRSKQAQIAAQIKDLESRNRQQTRKDDTRRKIIAGALALEHWRKNPKSDFAKKLFDLVDEYAKSSERRLFEDLGIKPAVQPENPANDQAQHKGGLKEEFRKEMG